MSLNPDEKHTNPEQDYFARKNLELMSELRKKLTEEEAQKAQEALQAAHYMHCPKCGSAMVEEMFQNVTIDRCGRCGYVGFDKGELEQIIKTRGGWLSQLLATFTVEKEGLKP